MQRFQPGFQGIMKPIDEEMWAPLMMNDRSGRWKVREARGMMGGQEAGDGKARGEGQGVGSMEI